MPNWLNIYSPITLIGNGRSGTSLISQAFRAHTDCVYVGETVNLIQSTYYSLASSLPQPRKSDIPDIIRGIFLHLYPTKKKFWFHKPIGIPIIYKNFPNDDDFCNWYWNVIDLVFPHASYFTVLRNPYDVIISSEDWWGRSQKSIVESHLLVAKLISNPNSKVNLAVHYEDLVLQPEANLKKLCEHIHLPFQESMLGVFDKTWSVKGNENGDELSNEVRRQQLTKKDKWHRIELDNITDEFKETTEKVWNKFDFKVEWNF